MREFINLITEGLLQEIESGMSLSYDPFDAVAEPSEHDERQLDLFDKTPNERKLKFNYEDLGNIGALVVSKVETKESGKDEGKKETYVVRTKNKTLVAYMLVEEVQSPHEHYFAGKPIMIKVAEVFRGKNIGIEFFLFLLGHEYDLLMADEDQTDKGKRLWLNMVMDKRLAVYGHGPEDGDAWEPIRTAEELEVMYEYHNTEMFVTLPGRWYN